MVAPRTADPANLYQPTDRVNEMVKRGTVARDVINKFTLQYSVDLH